MKTNPVIVSVAFLAATVAVAGPAHATSNEEEPENEQCVNYGNQVALSVQGDATIECVAQYCQTAPAGAASVGTGVGVNAGEGEAGASATAGAGCEQDAGNGTSAARSFPWT